MRWLLSSGHDPEALKVVDGTCQFEGKGPHYSRRTPGSKSLTGVGREIVLLSECGNAVWAVVYQKTPARKGTGTSRGRVAVTDPGVRFLWRNMMFRNLGAGLSSELIKAATSATYFFWKQRYGELPSERMRTEIGVRNIRSSNPGYCYQKAGWEKGEVKRGKLFLYAPENIS